MIIGLPKARPDDGVGLFVLRPKEYVGWLNDAQDNQYLESPVAGTWETSRSDRSIACMGQRKAEC